MQYLEDLYGNQHPKLMPSNKEKNIFVNCLIRMHDEYFEPAISLNQSMECINYL